MIRILPLVLLLTACGVDGRPVPPSQAEETPQGGFTISGSTEFGISRRF